jgi:hypothetical protein
MNQCSSSDPGQPTESSISQRNFRARSEVEDAVHTCCKHFAEKPLTFISCQPLADHIQKVLRWSNVSPERCYSHVQAISFHLQIAMLSAGRWQLLCQTMPWSFPLKCEIRMSARCSLLYGSIAWFVFDRSVAPFFRLSHVTLAFLRCSSLPHISGIPKLRSGLHMSQRAINRPELQVCFSSLLVLITTSWFFRYVSAFK